MTGAPTSEAGPARATPLTTTRGGDPDGASGRLRPVLWRLHFLSGLLAAPLTIWLALTGIAIAWAPQIEQQLYGDRKEASATGDPLPLSDQVAAVVEDHPGYVVTGITPAAEPGDTTAVDLTPTDAGTDRFGGMDGALTAHVDPVDGHGTGHIEQSQLPLDWLRRLHSSFRLGTTASTVTELAASWILVSLVTGLYLWWPRSRPAARRSLSLPLRGLRGGGRRAWRTVHSTIGAVTAAAVLALVVTGLTWTEHAGDWVDRAKDALSAESPTVQTALGTAPADEAAASGGRASTGDAADPGEIGEPGATAGSGEPGAASGEAAESGIAAGEAGDDDGGAHHAGEGGDDGAGLDLAALDSVALAPSDAGLEHPYTITPPAVPGQAWTIAESDTEWPIETSTVAVDPGTGEVVDRVEFSERSLIDQATTLGIGFHQAELFGLANQILLTLVAFGIIALLVTGYMTWWRRRPPGAFGAPPKAGPLLRTVPVPLLLGFGLLMVVLPTLGVSFVIYLVIERLVRAGRRSAPVAA